MKNLGRIILFLILIIPNILNASVSATVDAQSVSVGEVVTLNISMSGEDIKKPNLTQICGNDVISSSSQTNIQMVNLDYQKTYTLSYQFVPKKSCTIEPIEVSINGKIEKTEPVKIEVKPFVQDKNADFQLVLSTDKKELYVGEPFEVTLLFKQKRSVEAVDSKFVPPDLKGFWVKGETQPTRYVDGEYTVTKLIYKLAAQREGMLNVTPAQMRIAQRVHSRSNWGSFVPNVKWKSYFSNELNITAKALPNGMNLVGDFIIDLLVDKTEINPNEAVNITIEVRGKGNLEDIKTFKPYIQGVSVFDEQIVVNGEKLTQKIAFVSDEDFVIPSFSLEYFDLLTKKPKKIQTKEIPIHVSGTKLKKELVVKKEAKPVEEEKEVQVKVVSNEMPILYSVAIFIFGLILGIVLMLLSPWKIFNKERSVSLKDPKILLVKLIPYKDDERVKSIMDILENNIYSKEKIQVEKKLLKEIIKTYDIR
jgi:hypothetical protein